MNKLTRHSFLRRLLLAGAVVGLLACRKEYDPVFSDTADQRLQQVLNHYDSLLVGAPFGWKATLYTPKGGGYFYYFDFQADGSVTMLSDFNETAAGTPQASSWTLKALQRPTLSFNSYSYLHLPADPSGNVNGGNDGEGLGSDFEYALVGTSNDSIQLQGIQRSTPLVLRKATEQESQAIHGKRLLTILQGTRAYIAANRGLRLVLPDGTTVPLFIDSQRKIVAAQYLTGNAGNIQAFSSPFAFTIQGITLQSPLQVGGYAIRELLWSEDKGVYLVKLKEAAQELVNAEEPYIFHPSTPLHSVLGAAYKEIAIPEGLEAQPLPGQSSAFLAAYHAADSGMLAGQYRLTLHDMSFVLNPATQVMLLDVIISQTNNGATSRFLAEFGYSYTKSTDGVFKFTFLGANQNGWAIFGDMEGILTPLGSDAFKVEYVGGGPALLGGFFSQENPEFSCTGYLTP